ncbi:hypothetical protein C8R47DRAFT_1048627 [Mycena vitilis]|nr:hypothetical protein C8R47DRAFT_1048627 [Mycena vitilis]
MRKSAQGTKIDTLVEHGRAAALALREVSDDEQNVPYLKVIGGITLLILDIIKNVRANKQQCHKMIERINDIVRAIINICGEPGTELSPAMLRSITSFAETLQKVHSFIRNQVDMNMVQRIARHIENEAQLNECNVALQQALDVFTLRSVLLTATGVAEMIVSSAKKHDELVDRFESRIELASIASSSSSSLSILLPASPPFFRGREAELKHLVSHLLSLEPSRSVILGPGGIGKTTLALAALHHPDIIAAFGENRFFVPLESVSAPDDMWWTIAAYFGVEQRGKVAKAVIRHLSAFVGPSVLVLDNFESPWEQQSTRSTVEEILSLLTDIPRLRIIVTMRGAERPTRTRWSRPFLPPLEPLDRAAARETFLDIVDQIEDDSQLDEVLNLTDNLPLALTILANIASYEGIESVLRRWSLEATSLLSDGFDKHTNLETSISISLSSPRMAALPDARNLLSVLSLLPDGIPDPTLSEISLPFDDVVRCKITLCRTSLAYIGPDRRIKVLAPIREYISANPISPELFRPVKAYVYSIVRLSQNFELLPSTGIVHLLSSNLGNIHTVLTRALASYRHDHPSELKEMVLCVVHLAKFSYFTNLASWSSQLVDGVQDVVKSLDDKQLLGQYLLTVGQIHAIQSSHESYAKEALQCFKDVDDRLSQAKTCVFLSAYYSRTGEARKSLQICEEALPHAESAGDPALLAEVLVRLSQIHRQLGHSLLALKYAREGWRKAKLAGGNMLVEARAIRQYGCCCVSVGDYARCIKLCAEARVVLDALGMCDMRNSIYRNLLNLHAQTLYLQTDFALARQLNALLVGTPGEQRTEEKVSEAYALINVAGSDIVMGRSGDPAVKKNIETARTMMAGTSNMLGIVGCDFTLAHLYFHQGNYVASRALYSPGLLAVQGQSAEMELLCRLRLVDIAFADRDVQCAKRLSFVLFSLALRVGDLGATHHALRRIGDIFLSEGDSETAQNIFELALSGFTIMDIHQARGDCLIRLGDINRARGEYETARAKWKEARALFDRCSQLGDAQKCHDRIATTE